MEQPMETESKDTMIPLDDRAVLAVGGRDRSAFLQGLISVDVEKMAIGTAAWGALLTPQGRWLHDFFLFRDPTVFLLEGEKARLDDLALRLDRYRLRRDVTIAPMPLFVAAQLGARPSPPSSTAPAPAAAPLAPDTPQPHTAQPHRPGNAERTHGEKNGKTYIFDDPRTPDMGKRVWAEHCLGPTQKDHRPNQEDHRYDRRRLTLGLSDAGRDMDPGKSLPAQYNFDYLGALDWNKGCYMGQEGVARVYYRGLMRRRAVPFQSNGQPQHGDPVMADGKPIGTIRSVCNDQEGGVLGLALLDLEPLQAALKTRGSAVTSHGIALDVTFPPWFTAAAAKAPVAKKRD